MALSPEHEAQILRYYHAERWRIGTIAVQLGLHRDTVARVLAQAARVRQLRSQVLVFARAHFQKCHYNSASCSGVAGFSIPKA